MDDVSTLFCYHHELVGSGQCILYIICYTVFVRMLISWFAFDRPK